MVRFIQHFHRFSQSIHKKIKLTDMEKKNILKANIFHVIKNAF